MTYSSQNLEKSLLLRERSKIREAWEFLAKRLILDKVVATDNHYRQQQNQQQPTELSGNDLDRSLLELVFKLVRRFPK